MNLYNKIRFATIYSDYILLKVQLLQHYVLSNELPYIFLYFLNTSLNLSSDSDEAEDKVHILKDENTY